MSLATFKKKSINSAASATKRSGKPTNKYWIYSGPYGRNGNLPSTIFLKSIVGPDGQIGDDYDAINAGFSINGANRNIGGVGGCMKFSKSRSPFRGTYPKGWGGTRGRYPDGPNNVSLTVYPQTSGPQLQSAVVKPSVLRSIPVNIQIIGFNQNIQEIKQIQ